MCESHIFKINIDFWLCHPKNNCFDAISASAAQFPLPYCGFRIRAAVSASGTRFPHPVRHFNIGSSDLVPTNVLSLILKLSLTGLSFLFVSASQNRSLAAFHICGLLGFFETCKEKTFSAKKCSSFGRGWILASDLNRIVSCGRNENIAGEDSWNKSFSIKDG